MIIAKYIVISKQNKKEFNQKFANFCFKEDDVINFIL